MRKLVTFDPEKLERLKEAYREHETKNVSEGSTFWFEGHEYVPAYAKYLIEFLEKRFKREH